MRKEVEEEDQLNFWKLIIHQIRETMTHKTKNVNHKRWILRILHEINVLILQTLFCSF